MKCIFRGKMALPLSEFQLNLVAPYPLTENIKLINKVKLPWDTRPTGEGTETALGKVNYQAYFSQATPMSFGDDFEVSFGLGPSVNFNTSQFDNQMFGDDSTQAALPVLPSLSRVGFPVLQATKSSGPFQGMTLTRRAFNWSLDTRGIVVSLSIWRPT